MLRTIDAQGQTNLTELSIKQREMLMDYRRDRVNRERERHLDEQVTWRDVIRESRVPLLRPRISGEQ